MRPERCGKFLQAFVTPVPLCSTELSNVADVNLFLTRSLVWSLGPYRLSQTNLGNQHLVLCILQSFYVPSLYDYIPRSTPLD
jgi:hypothetical protein